MLEKLTMEDFAKYLNHTFRIHFEAEEKRGNPSFLEAELVEVSQLGERHEGEGRRQSFSIIFRGPDEPVLPQQIYSIEHDDLGRLDLFLVPLGPAKGGMLYEAVFT